MRFHSRIRHWMIVECIAPGEAVTQHVQGWIVSHARLSPDGELSGELYLGSPLGSMDLENGVAVNHRGRVIDLVGPRYPDGELPHELRQMQARAEADWGLPDGTTWRRIA